MSSDRTATVMFAHWPSRSSCWYEDLRRIAAYGAVLGKFFDDDRVSSMRPARSASRSTTSPTSTARPT